MLDVGWLNKELIFWVERQAVEENIELHDKCTKFLHTFCNINDILKFLQLFKEHSVLFHLSPITQSGQRNYSTR